MEFETSSHLDSTIRMLGSSLRTRSDDPAPALPADLRADLEARFARPVAAPATSATRASWFARLTSALSTPGFAIAAAAIMILAVVAPLTMDRNAESFRGSASVEFQSIPVLLVHGPAGIADQLALAGDLEATSLKTLSQLSEVENVTGPKVVVDFASSIIRSVDADGHTVHEATLPTGADLTRAIAEAVTHL